MKYLLFEVRPEFIEGIAPHPADKSQTDSP
jgi:hypothetical protein